MMGAMSPSPGAEAGPNTAGPPSAADVLRAALTDDVERLAEHEPGVRKGVDPEAVHQARVATRRLRSQLRTFRPALRAGPTKRLGAPLKNLAGLLGDVRDLDVLAERFDSGGAGAEGRSGNGEGSDASVPGAVVADVLAKLARERDAAFVRLIDVMDSQAYRKAFRDLEAFAADPPFRRVAFAPAPEVLGPSVRAVFGKLEGAVCNLPVVPSDGELHQVRIRAKRARYAAQAASAFGPPGCSLLAKRLGKLQDVLGLLNDGSRSVAWLRQIRSQPPEPFGAPGGTGATALSGDSYVAGIELLVARQHLAMAAAREEWPSRWVKVREAAGALGWLSTP
jgi:CHAD domain-containing protein